MSIKFFCALATDLIFSLTWGSRSALTKNRCIMRQLLLFTGVVALCVLQTPVLAQSSHGVKVVSFTAKTSTSPLQVAVSWSIGDNPDLETIVLEHAVSRAGFTPLATFDHVSNGQEIVDYSYLHTNPSPSANYYRLRFIFTDRSEYVIRPIVAYLSRPIFTTPTISGKRMAGDPADPWIKGAITDLMGRPVLSFTGNEVIIESLPPGVYVVRVQDSSGWQASLFTR